MLMKKLLLSAMPLFCAALAANAQSSALSEGFEGTDVPPQGWTVRTSSDDSSNKFKWQQVAYTGDPLKYRSGYTHGGTYAMMSSSGKTTTAGVQPDSWLISPAVSVASGDVLSFMLAYAPVYNDAIMSETDRSKFAVLVSTTGTEAADFTDTLMVFTPYGETDWRKKAYSLNKYAGKTVYIAFRDYGNGTVGSAFLLNYTYIDDVTVGQGSESDLAVTNIVSPVAGPETQQNITFEYSNTAMPNTSFTASYSVNDGEPVSETLESGYECASGETKTFKFSSPATLTAGADNAVKVWVTADNDQVHENDTLSATVKIDNVFSLPYEMTTANNADGWTYTYHKKSGKNYTGWWRISDGSPWTYSLCAKESILEGKWFALEQGKVNLTFGYSSGTELPMSLFLTDYNTGKVDTIEVTLPASTELATAKTSIAVAADGKYKLGLKPGSTYYDSAILYSLSMSKAVPGDVAVTAVTLPKAVTVGEYHPIYIKVKNNGEQEANDIPVKVVVDSVLVDEDIIPAIAAGETVDWNVGQGTAAAVMHGVNLSAGDHDVKVFTLFEDDADASNDTISTSVYAYEKLTLPFSESFETEDGNKIWLAENLSNNALNWTIGTAKVGNVNWAKDGENAAYMSSVANTEHNAVLRSPVISVDEATTVRLSYYYTTRMKATDATDVTLLTATVNSLSSDTTFAVSSCSDSITDANAGVYRQGYMLVTFPEAGDYQIEFLNTGMGHDVVLDDVRLDQSTDIAVVSASQTAKSGFNNTVNNVSVTFANHGATTVDKVSLKLVTATASGAAVETTGEYAQSVAPGDTVTFDFDAVDVSAAGTYTSIVSVSTSEDDADTFNNTYSLSTFESYANAAMPYTADFDTDSQQAQWVLGGTWQTGVYSSSSSAYNGTGAISHHKKASAEDGDWAFSGCIEIPAGTYDLSFFYRTFLNGKTQKLYAQNFAFFLGTEPEAEAMTQTLYTSPADVLAYEKRYRRVEQQFTVEEGGKYYIGVKCTSQSAYGVLYLDNIQLYDAAKTAPALASYKTEFADFYRYDPSSQFSQWKDATQDGGIEATQKIFNAGNPQTELPGIIVSPAFTLSAGTILSANLNYAMSADGNLSDEAKAQMKTTLYLSPADTLASNAVVLADGTDISGKTVEATSTLNVTETAPYYFIVKVEGPTNSADDNAQLAYRLYSLTLKTDADCISSVTGNSGKVKLYNANGMLLGEYDNQAEAMKNANSGVNLLKFENGGKTVKVVK